MKSVNDFDPGAYGPLGIVFVGHRIPEIHEYPISEILRDIAVIPFDGLGADRLIGTDNRAQLFWIKLGRERGGTHEVTEHHCQLATLPGKPVPGESVGGQPGRVRSSEFGV